MSPHWAQLPDDHLMELRICDVAIPLRETWVQGCVDQLHDELRRAGFRYFRPRVYLGEDWYTPEDSCVISIPFYITHPTLRRIEQQRMRDVEGGSPATCMRLLRHEAGHCFDHSYQISQTPRFQRLFGSPRRPYQVDHYPYVINSTDHVTNLADHYAQAHPLEDFAETFAVWLDPESRWKQTYADKPRALQKLRYIDRLATLNAPLRTRDLSRAPMGEARRLRRPLEKFYRERHSYYG